MPLNLCWLIAQELPAIPPAAAAAVTAVARSPLWQVLIENGLALTILFIFLTAIISVVLTQRRRDKCLRLMDDYHVSYLSQKGSIIWGELQVFARGLEVRFDTPYRTQRGIYKTSQLIYEKETEQCLAICRTVNGLSPHERRRRRGQIRRSFRPNVFRRVARSLRNLLGTLKDAFSQALTALIGTVMKTAAKGSALAGQQTGVTEIGKTLIGAAGNAYEQILERHIGKPVVLQMRSASDPALTVDLPGYLVDYSDRYLAVFNVEHEPIAVERVAVHRTVETPGYRLELTGGQLKITCTGGDALVVRSIQTRSRFAELEIALTHGCCLTLSLDGGSHAVLELERTRRIDIVCPRSQGVICFGGQYADKERECERRFRPAGMAPEADIEERSNPRLPGDPLEGEIRAIDSDLIPPAAPAPAAPAAPAEAATPPSG